MRKISAGMRARIWMGSALVFFWMAEALAEESLVIHKSALEAELKNWQSSQADLVRTLTRQLEEQQIDPKPLLWKLREGVAKKVPEVKIGQVLQRVTESLLWLSPKIAGCAFAPNKEEFAAFIFAASDILLGSLQRAELEKMLPYLCPVKDGWPRLAKTLELYSYLENHFKVKPEINFAFVLILLERNELMSQAASWVAIFQDIVRERGNCEAAVLFSVKRLKTSASARSVQNDLKSQFLRR